MWANKKGEARTKSFQLTVPSCQVVVVRQKLEPHLKPGREVPVVKTELVGEETVLPEEKTH